MNKKDIKLGVEYAWTSDPAAFRRGSASGNPTRVVVRNLAGRDKRLAYSSYSYNGLYEEKIVSGIEVEWPVTLKGSRYLRDADGQVRRDKKTNQPMTESFEVTYPTRFFENARGFLMTWAEWEQEQVRRAAVKVERERLARESAQTRTNADPRKRAMAERVFTAIEDRLGSVVKADLTDTTYTGRTVEVVGLGRIGDVKHGSGIDAEDVILDVQFSLGLSTLAKLLGVFDA